MVKFEEGGDLNDDLSFEKIEVCVNCGKVENECTCPPEERDIQSAENIKELTDHIRKQYRGAATEEQVKDAVDRIVAGHTQKEKE